MGYRSIASNDDGMTEEAIKKKLSYTTEDSNSCDVCMIVFEEDVLIASDRLKAKWSTPSQPMLKAGLTFSFSQ
jgi:hypothetical protein